MYVDVPEEKRAKCEYPALTYTSG